MRIQPFPLFLVALLVFGCATEPNRNAPTLSRLASPDLPASPRITESFDAGWKFTRSDTATEQPGSSNANWLPVTLPHDWSIAGPFDEKSPTGAAGAFLPNGIGWYRKQFRLPPATKGRRVFIEFDGVMQNSDVWINGVRLGHRPYGYVSFRYELTDHLRFDPEGDNVLVVRTDTSAQPASRWYSGAGIYRHVRLVTMDALHVAPWSTTVGLIIPVSPQPEGQERWPIAHVATEVQNQSNADASAAVRIQIVDAIGRVVARAQTTAQTVAAGAVAKFEQDLPMTNPTWWDVDHPYLYRALVEVQAGDRRVDRETVTFGVREAHFTHLAGFVLNGRPLKLYGVCLHHDGGAFGAAVPLAVWEQRLAALRSLGVNAIRTAHNPPDPGFLDLCDRMGFLVMDELFDCWTVGKNPYDYHLFFEEWSKTDVRDTVLRDRNHPSVVLWSAGNEIHDTPQEEKAKRILGGLVETFHQNGGWPVTQALFRPNVSHDYTNGLADLLDVIGTNYRDQELLAAWQAKPNASIVGTEQRHDNETWVALRDHPQHSGQFLWTGVDYLGEARRWPYMTNGAGLLDRTGEIKAMARERQSWWTTKPMVAIARRVAQSVRSTYDPGYEPANTAPIRRQYVLADWSPANPQPHDENVEVYSNCETVELFLNGKSLGAKPLHRDASARQWKVPFAPGTLRAEARNGGRTVATDALRTAGAPVRLVLSASRPTLSTSWEDVVRITAHIVDADGVTVPGAAAEIGFSVDGPATIVATDNADMASHESFQAPAHHTYLGSCVAWVRATAPSDHIVVHASAPGLEPAAVTLSASTR